MNEKIEWRYPIKGVTESVVNAVIYHLKAQCRFNVEEEMKIQLPGVNKSAFFTVLLFGVLIS